jgi:hypothetical protein
LEWPHAPSVAPPSPSKYSEVCVHEHHGEIGKQGAPVREQPLLHEVLDAARCQRAVGLLGRGQFLAEPGHGAVELMELKTIGALDAVTLTPLLAGAVGAGHHQPMQHREKDGAFDREAEATRRQELVQHRGTASLTPQALEDQRRADAPAAELRDGLVGQRDHHGALRLAGGGGDQDRHARRRPPCVRDWR